MRERFSDSAAVRDLEVPAIEVLEEGVGIYPVSIETPDGIQELPVAVVRESEHDPGITIINPPQWSDNSTRSYNKYRYASLRSHVHGARVVTPDMPGVLNSSLTREQIDHLHQGRFDAVARAQWIAMDMAQRQALGLDPTVQMYDPRVWEGRRLLLNGYSMGTNQVAALMHTMPQEIRNAVDEIVVLITESPSLRQRSVGSLALNFALGGGQDMKHYMKVDGAIDPRLGSSIHVKGIFTAASLRHTPQAMAKGALLHELTTLQGSDATPAELFEDGKVKVVIAHGDGKYVSPLEDNQLFEDELKRAGIDVERRHLYGDYHPMPASFRVFGAIARMGASNWAE